MSKAAVRDARRPTPRSTARPRTSASGGHSPVPSAGLLVTRTSPWPLGLLLGVAGTGVASALPTQWRALVVLPLALGLLAWSTGRLARRHLPLTLEMSVGAGVALSLATWTLLGLLELAAGVGLSRVAVWGVFALVTLGSWRLGSRKLPWPERPLDPPRDRALPRWPRLHLTELLDGRHAALAGGAVLVAAGAVDIVAGNTFSDNDHGTQVIFGSFWLGMAMMYGPPVVTAFRRPLGRWTSTWALGTLAFASMWPLIVRAPLQPLVYDEIGHWGEAVQLSITGRLLEPDSVVAIGPYFPGLETLTVPLHVLGGAPVFMTGHVLLVLMHFVTLTGLATLTRLATNLRRAPLCVAALYAVSPSFLRIDGWYAYESLAVPLAIWLVVVCVLVAKGAPGRVPVLLAATLGLSLVVTHHLSTYVTATMLLIATLAAWWSQRRSRPQDEQDEQEDGTGPVGLLVGLSAKRLGACTAALAVAAAAWATALQIPVLVYLDVFPKAGVETFRKLLGQSKPPASSRVIDGATQVRSVFGGGGLPIYEPVLALAAQPVLLGLCLWAVWRWRRSRSPVLLLGVALTAAYFISLPFTLSGLGTAGAHRSWAFSYLGVALLLGVAYARRVGDSPRLRPALLAATGLMLLLVGNYGSATTALEQFPGPFVLNSDGRNVDNYLVHSAEWFAAHEGRGQTILTNARSMAVFGAWAHAQTPNDFPTWELWFPTDAPPGATVTRARDEGVRFLVVDTRLATDKPLDLPYFDNYEPLPPSIPLPAASIAKFDVQPWLSLVHVDGPVRIYAVRPA